MAITLTERAIKEVKSILQQNSLPDQTCLRVGVKGGGCSGFTYVLDMVPAPAEGDEVFPQDGIRIVCDPKSYLYLGGTEVDYKDELLNRGFIFNNPNAKGSCGCGSSFTA